MEWKQLNQLVKIGQRLFASIQVHSIFPIVNHLFSVRFDYNIGVISAHYTKDIYRETEAGETCFVLEGQIDENIAPTVIKISVYIVHLHSI